MTASRLVLRTIRYGGGWASLLAVTSLTQAGATASCPPYSAGRWTVYSAARPH